jgi:hypothetical protein
MQKWLIYDYINERGENEIAEWTRNLQKRERAKLRSKLIMIAENGPNLPGLLLKTEVEYIYKIKVQGNPKLRPMICFGPFNEIDEETKEECETVTLLVGAKEISWDFEPKGADIEAGIRRQIILHNRKRRTRHERIN